jgi:hypothetical protein
MPSFFPALKLIYKFNVIAIKLPAHFLLLHVCHPVIIVTICYWSVHRKTACYFTMSRYVNFSKLTKRLEVK